MDNANLLGALDDVSGRQVAIVRDSNRVRVLIDGVTELRFTPADLTVLIGYLAEAQSDATLAEITND